jgi:hypothetical protein
LCERIDESVGREEGLAVFVKLMGTQTEASSVQDAARLLDRVMHERVMRAFEDLLR